MIRSEGVLRSSRRGGSKGTRAWRRRICLPAIVLALGSATALVTGCSEDTHRSRQDSRSFTQQVTGLAQGASLDAVKTELGVPRSEFSVEDEVILNYVPWQLRFVDGMLWERRRERRPEGASVSGRVLDQRVVFALKLGMSVRSVETRLGTPDAFENVYRGTGKRYSVLRYGPWELTFSDGRLTHRTSY